MGKSVGILTFHYADNHGAVLQAYALRKVINSFPDYTAEIINYVPEGYHYPVLPGGNRFNEQKIKRDKFEKFLSENCGINKPMIHAVTGNAYDVYLVGSDQIWNTDIVGTETDCEYLLPNLNESAKRIAYSASVGMELERIDRKLFQKYLPKFQAISLREKSYVEIISELSGMKCDYTLDPTMLLREKDYKPLLKKPDDVEGAYILYFWYDMGDGGFRSIELVNALARKYNLSVKHTFLSEMSVARQMLVNNGGCVLQAGIGEFLWYVKNAQIVVTNSFHGAVFSVLFKKPLYIYYPEIRKCRQENLVEMLHIEDRVVKGYIYPDELSLEIDYTFVFEALEKERERSIFYLKTALAVI